MFTIHKQHGRGTALLITGIFLGVGLGQVAPALGQNLGDILKGAAVIFLVDKFHADINKFVNQITGNVPNSEGIDNDVVPILSVGSGTYAGAVQISGPKDRVQEVRAAAQIEGEKKFGGKNVRVRVLIPISNRNVKDISKLSRVKGVGTSALVDLHL